MQQFKFEVTIFFADEIMYFYMYKQYCIDTYGDNGHSISRCIKKKKPGRVFSPLRIKLNLSLKHPNPQASQMPGLAVTMKDSVVLYVDHELSASHK